MAIFAGFEEKSVFSPDLQIEYPVFIFYPTQTSATPQLVGPFAFEAALKSPIQAGQHPLVILSHGSGGGPLLYRSLAVGLAKAGCIVAAPEHPFNNRVDNSRADSMDNLIQRPKSITEVIEFVVQDSNLGPQVDKDRIAVIGHSMGAYAALGAAGGVPHTKHQIAYNPNTQVKESVEVPTTKDARLRSLILLAPAAGWFLSEGALERVTAPIHIVAAEQDQMTTMRHSDLIKAGAKNSWVVTQWIVPNAGHFSFISPFPEKMRNSRFPPAMDPPGFDRDLFQVELLENIKNKLNEHFGFENKIAGAKG